MKNTKTIRNAYTNCYEVMIPYGNYLQPDSHRYYLPESLVALLTGTVIGTFIATFVKKLLEKAADEFWDEIKGRIERTKSPKDQEEMIITVVSKHARIDPSLLLDNQRVKKAALKAQGEIERILVEDYHFPANTAQKVASDISRIVIDMLKTVNAEA